MLLNRIFSVLAALALVLLARTTLAAERDDVDAERKESSSRPGLVVQASGGPAYGRLYDLPFWAGEGALGLGLRLPKFAVTFDAHYAHAESNEGLVAEWGGVRSTALFTPWRLRVGGGFDMVYFSLDRVTTSGDIARAGIGVFAHVGIDVVQIGHSGVEIAMLPEATLLVTKHEAGFLSDSLALVAHY